MCCVRAPRHRGSCQHLRFSTAYCGRACFVCPCSVTHGLPRLTHVICAVLRRSSGGSDSSWSMSCSSGSSSCSSLRAVWSWSSGWSCRGSSCSTIFSSWHNNYSTSSNSSNRGGSSNWPIDCCTVCSSCSSGMSTTSSSGCNSSRRQQPGMLLHRHLLLPHLPPTAVVAVATRGAAVVAAAVEVAAVRSHQPAQIHTRGLAAAGRRHQQPHHHHSQMLASFEMVAVCTGVSLCWLHVAAQGVVMSATSHMQREASTLQRQKRTPFGNAANTWRRASQI